MTLRHPAESIPDPVARAAFEKLCTRKHFAAGDWLLRAGERAVWAHFLVEGLVREFYVTAEGVEHNRSFITQGQFTGSLLDVLSGQPAVTWIEALEPTTTWSFKYADYDALADRYPSLQRQVRGIVETLAVRKTRREYEMLALDAKERYRRWLLEQPGVDARISKKMLASYLGITPEHLSRLRRTLK